MSEMVTIPREVVERALTEMLHVQSAGIHGWTIHDFDNARRKLQAALAAGEARAEPDAHNRRLRQQLEAEWAELQALKRAEDWTPMIARTPPAGRPVLVMAYAWSEPRVLRYVAEPWPRMRDDMSGHWFWFPERMRWRELPRGWENAR